MSCEFEQELMDLNDDVDAKQGKSVILFLVLWVNTAGVSTANFVSDSAVSY